MSHAIVSFATHDAFDGVRCETRVVRVINMPQKDRQLWERFLKLQDEDAGAWIFFEGEKKNRDILEWLGLCDEFEPVSDAVWSVSPGELIRDGADYILDAIHYHIFRLVK